MPPGTLACTAQDARKTVSASLSQTVKPFILHPPRHFTNFLPNAGELFSNCQTVYVSGASILYTLEILNDRD